MDNIRQFPDCRSIDEEAATWLVRLDADEPLNKNERAALAEWLGRSPRHREALKSLNQFWGNNILTELMVPLGRHENHGGMFALLRQIVFGWPKFSATAFASIALLVVASIFIFQSPEDTSNGLYVTAVGQQKTFLLDDGSRVHLNTDSQLDVSYGENYRNLRLLQGEAYFEVAKNPDRPFRVYAGAGRVQAVGTAFNVHLEDTGLNVLVTEGRVALASLGEPLLNEEYAEELEVDPYVQSKSRTLGMLAAGELVNLNIAEDLSSLKPGLAEEIELVKEVDLSRVESWREGYMFFSGEPLEQVVAEISRYTTISIEIADPDLKHLQIGGRFKAGDIESMFAALEANFGIEIKQLNYNKVELTVAQ